MCGIAGILDRHVPQGHWESLLKKMAGTLRHRGPDDFDLWCDPDLGLGFAHTRLSIVDLSPAGRQPMVSSDGRYRIVFNGEIYNFLDLRRELGKRGHAFRSQSDTEVMLAAISEWGIEAALERFNGMFAFALWDALECQIHLVRDRVGEKPIFYGTVGQGFAFASELKALRTLPDFRATIDRASLALLLENGYIPSPYSIYRGIHKLAAGTILTINVTDECPPSEAKHYWKASKIAEESARKPRVGGTEEIVDQLDSLLHRAIRRRLVADVPIGAFLSGGIDSSLVVAIMQSLEVRPVKTFTVGFADRRFDESPYARAVARHLGTDHTEVRVTPEEAMALIPQLPSMWDEPLADPAQVPTHLVSRLARNEVKVVLSGDGGDELFGGYQRYQEMEWLWNMLRPVPRPLRLAVSRFLRVQLPLARKVVLAPFAKTLGKLDRLSEILAADSIPSFYQQFFSQCPSPRQTVLNAEPSSTMWTSANSWLGRLALQDRLMYLDFMTYLPDNVLVKLDRASMWVNLEGRLPLLDPEIIQFAWSLPIACKIRHRQGKWILRRVLDRHIPRQFVERPKHGFEVPIGSWLRGPLRPWAEGLLDPARLRREGFFQEKIVERRWREHLQGLRDWRFFLWTVLMFQQWLQHETSPQ